MAFDSNDQVYEVILLDSDLKMHDLARHALGSDNFNLECCKSAEKCLKSLKRNDYHILISETDLPDMSALQFLGKAKQISPDTEVIFMSDKANVHAGIEAIKNGDCSLIKKPTRDCELIEHIETGLTHANGDLLHGLTSSELQVLRHILDGNSNRETARKMHRSVRTIEVHRSNIMKKLEVANTVELVKKAICTGALDINNIGQQ